MKQINDAIYNLRNGNAPGYNGLTAEHWKNCNSNSLNRYLQHLIQYIVNNGTIPSVWKIGIITFLLKPDKPNDA